MYCTLYQNTMYPFVVLHIQLTEFHETRKIWHGYHRGNILFGVSRWDTARAVHQVIVIRQKHFRLNLVEIKTLSLKVPFFSNMFVLKTLKYLYISKVIESCWWCMMTIYDNDNDRPKQFQIWVHVGRCALLSMTWRYGGVLSWQLQ